MGDESFEVMKMELLKEGAIWLFHIAVEPKHRLQQMHSRNVDVDVD